MATAGAAPDLSILDEQFTEMKTIITALEERHGDNSDKIDECRVMIEQANITISGLKPSATKTAYQSKLRDIRGKLDRLALLGPTSSKKVPSSSHGLPSHSGEEEHKLSEEGLKSLQDSLITLVETEEVAKDTAMRLEQQRRKVEKISKNSAAIRADLTESNRNATKMLRRENPLSSLFR